MDVIALRPVEKRNGRLIRPCLFEGTGALNGTYWSCSRCEKILDEGPMEKFANSVLLCISCGQLSELP